MLLNRIGKKKWFNVTFAFCFSHLAWLVLWFFDFTLKNLPDEYKPIAFTIAGYVVYVGVITLVSKLSHVYGKPDWVIYGMTLFSFTCVLDLIVWLEYLGAINGVFTQYLKHCEPYLFSSWGAGIGLYDQMVFYGMYLTMIWSIENEKSWRSLSIYWSAGLLNSMCVEVFGGFVGINKVTIAVILNVPYFVLPIAVLHRALKNERRNLWKESIHHQFSKSFESVKKLLLDMFQIVLLLGSIVIISAKGLSAMGSDSELIGKMVSTEPFLHLVDPAPFGKIQAIQNYFWVMPMCFASLYFIFQKFKPAYLWEMSLLHAGIMIHSQFNFIYASVDPLTKEGFQSDWTNLQFWIMNLVPVICPHIYLFRLLEHKSSQNEEKLELKEENDSSNFYNKL